MVEGNEGFSQEYNELWNSYFLDDGITLKNKLNIDNPFELDKKDECSLYMLKAEAICPGSNYIAWLKKLNKAGQGLFTYNREHSGVDKNTDPNAKDL